MRIKQEDKKLFKANQILNFVRSADVLVTSSFKEFQDCIELTINRTDNFLVIITDKFYAIAEL